MCDEYIHEKVNGTLYDNDFLKEIYLSKDKNLMFLFSTEITEIILYYVIILYYFISRN